MRAAGPRQFRETVKQDRQMPPSHRFPPGRTFRRKATILAGDVDLVGLGRPFCVDQEIAAKLLNGEVERAVTGIDSDQGPLPRH
jgi:2,4-dienoyl-CoA reductase-like NADH-dependent reductase (Old Yellow Enzyme family)